MSADLGHPPHVQRMPLSPEGEETLRSPERDDDEPYPPIPVSGHFVYDPYGGEPRREDLDPDFDISQYRVTDEEGGDDDNPTPFLSFRDLLLSMQTLNASLPPPTETSVKRWARRAMRRCSDVELDDITNSVADAFSDAYLLAAGMDTATLTAHAEAAERAAREELSGGGGDGGVVVATAHRKRRARKGRGKGKPSGDQAGEGPT